MTDPVPGAVVVIAKRPEVGRSKTRLAPPLTLEQAAAIAQAALDDTLAAVAAADVERRVVAYDGEPGEWIPADFERIAQRGDGLDERLAAVFDDLACPAVIIAMDTPQVTPELLEDALAALGGTDVVLGATDDGGYWIVGLASSAFDVIRGVPMSRDDTLDHQLARVAEGGYSHVMVPPLRDVDHWEDAVAVAAEIPGSHLAAAIDEIRSRQVDVIGQQLRAPQSDEESAWLDADFE